jgi:hypothetical protein
MTVYWTLPQSVGEVDNGDGGGRNELIKVIQGF